MLLVFCPTVPMRSGKQGCYFQSVQEEAFNHRFLSKSWHRNQIPRKQDPRKGEKVSFRIRENPTAARHKQKAIWQPLTGMAFSFSSSPVAMETAAVCPPSRGRWHGWYAELRGDEPSQSKISQHRIFALMGTKGCGMGRCGVARQGQRPMATCDGAFHDLI